MSSAPLKAQRMAERTEAKLTAKQEAFYREYLETGNATEAYRRSYNTAGMKSETVNRCAFDLLNHHKISARLAANSAKMLQIAEDRYQVTQERVLRELALLGFSNMMDYVTPQQDGTAYVDLSKLTRDQAAAISEVTVESYTEKDGESVIPVKRVKFKLSDKRSALVDLGKHLGTFAADNDQRGKAAGEAMGKVMGGTEFARWLAFKLASGAQPGGTE